MNNDDFTVLVSGGSRRHWVMCTGWPWHSKWASRAMNPHPILHEAWIFLHGNYLDDWEGFQGRCNECSANKSVAQMLQRWLRICWKWPAFWKACNKQDTWESWTCTGCNQHRSVTAVRIRSWTGDSKSYCVQDFDAGSWHETCSGNIRSATSDARAEGTSRCSC